MSKLKNINIAITLALFLMMGFRLTKSVYGSNDVSIYEENGVLENIQVSILIASCLLYISPVFFQKREDKLMLSFFSFVCFGFILREVDVEKLDVPQVLILLGSGPGRNGMLALGFLSMIIIALKHKHYYIELSRKLLTSVEGIFWFASAIFLQLADGFEDRKHIKHHIFIEEIIEMYGYVFLLLTALILLKHKMTPNSSSTSHLSNKASSAP